MGTVVSGKEKRVGLRVWDGAAGEVCCDGAETRGKPGRALYRLFKLGGTCWKGDSLFISVESPTFPSARMWLCSLRRNNALWETVSFSSWGCLIHSLDRSQLHIQSIGNKLCGAFLGWVYNKLLLLPLFSSFTNCIWKANIMTLKNLLFSVPGV